MSEEQSRILIIGASGQVGTALAAQFSCEHLVTASHSHARPDDIRIDLGYQTATRQILDELRPDVVLVAGAMCNAEQCEVDPDACESVNAKGPATVAEYARDSRARVVFFSSDHVFDGARDRYVESDPPSPLNAYARSKAYAEVLIRELLPDRHLIIRTGWVYGPDAQRRNFALRLVDRIAAGETVEVPSDQWGSPTYSEDLAQVVNYLLEHDAVGTFHATGPDFVDRGTLARRICDEFGVDRHAVVLRQTGDLGQIARRSLRVQLDCQKLQSAGAPPLRGIARGLRSLAVEGRG
jgi:dTDP-4-dehydrorhamnose reductase